MRKTPRPVRSASSALSDAAGALAGRSAPKAAPRGHSAGVISPRAARVAVLAFDDCMASSVTGPLELCAVANTLVDLTAPHADTRRLTGEVFTLDGGPVTCGQGIVLAGGKLKGIPDIVIVPGIWHGSAGGKFRDIGAHYAAQVALLRRLHDEGAIIAAVCSGTVLLGEAGLLDQRVSTTSWWLGERFRRRYPTTRLALDQMVTMDQRVWCAGAATATFNLMLKVIEHFSGPDIAGLVARFMLIDPGRVSQAPYMLHDFRPVAADPVVARAQKWAGSRLSEPFSLAAMANAAAVSSRTLIRHFRDATGLTPLAYIQKARVEEAKSLLSTGNLAPEKIVDRVGYADMNSFRRLFRQHTGMTPHDYREKFRVRARPAQMASA